MEKDVTKTPETHADELIDALKLISDIIVGQDMRAIEEFVIAMDKSRQDDQSNMERRMQRTLTKIREDVTAISDDIRHIKSETETDRKKSYEEFTSVRNQLQKTNMDLTQKISTTETTLQKNVTTLKEQIETNITDLAQEHNQRFTGVEDRITNCEDEGTARKEESSRLARLLSNAAQSLVVTGTAENSSIVAEATKQVDTLWSEQDDGDSSSNKDTSTHSYRGKRSKGSKKSKYQSKDKYSEDDDLADVDTVLNENKN